MMKMAFRKIRLAVAGRWGFNLNGYLFLLSFSFECVLYLHLLLTYFILDTFRYKINS